MTLNVRSERFVVKYRRRNFRRRFFRRYNFFRYGFYRRGFFLNRFFHGRGFFLFYLVRKLGQTLNPNQIARCVIEQVVNAFARNAVIVFIIRRNEGRTANGTYASIYRKRAFRQKREFFKERNQKFDNVYTRRLNTYYVFPFYFCIRNQPNLSFVGCKFFLVCGEHLFRRRALRNFVAGGMHDFYKMLNRTTANKVVYRETDIVFIPLLHDDLEGFFYQRNLAELDVCGIAHKQFFPFVFANETEFIQRAKHIDRHKTLKHIALGSEIRVPLQIMQIEIVAIIIMFVVQQDVGRP